MALPIAPTPYLMGSDAERFVAIVNRDRFDYTEWRRDNLFVNETVDSLFEKIKAYEAQEASR